MVLDFDNCEYILHYEIFNDSVYTLCSFNIGPLPPPPNPTPPHAHPQKKKGV